MRICFLVGVLAVSIGAPGCGTTSTTARLRTDDAGSLVLPPVNPATVIVSPFRDIGRPYDMVGVVIAASSTGEQPARTLGLLREEAAALGADAVVDARMELVQGWWKRAMKVSGVAVKLR